jgi:CPA1 family monovalent cation:H+ antiporter
MYSFRQLLLYGLMVSLVTIIVRVLWVFTAAVSPIITKSGTKQNNDRDTWKNVMVVAWTGTRGIVSLATALALPLTLSDGSAFPNRSLILFLAFVVIFVTLVVQGLSLPLLIKLLRIKNGHSQGEEERELRVQMAHQVINFIETDFPYEIGDELKSLLKSKHLQLIETFSSEKNRHSLAQHRPTGISEFLKAQPEVQHFERKLLIQWHKEGSFNQATIRRIEQELDLAELQLKRINNAKRR